MSLSLSIFCPSMGDHEAAVTSWRDTMTKPWDITIDDARERDAAGYLTKCEAFYENNQSDIQGYLHSDLSILQHGWDQRVLAEFDCHPSAQDVPLPVPVGVVGLVGARRLGSPDLYRLPYDYRQLARADVLSNLSDAEAHGARSAGAHDVAVIDSCAVFVRRDLLLRAGGWPVGTYPNNTHCTDLWLCLMARRLGMRVRMVGVAASHRSGGKGEAGAQWLDERGGDQAQHRRAHEVTYDMFRDVLPVEVL